MSGLFGQVRQSARVIAILYVISTMFLRHTLYMLLLIIYILVTCCTVIVAMLCCSVIESMALEERQNAANLEEIVSPFLVETGVATDEEATLTCRKIAVAFGSSGRAGHVFTAAIDDGPTLLEASVRIIDNSEQTGLKLNPTATYGKVMISSKNNGVGNIIGSNSSYDSKAIPTTQREARRMRRTADQLKIILDQEKAKRAAEQQVVIAERMKALAYQREQIAARAANKSKKSIEQAFNRHGSSIIIDRFSLPHPSGSGELLSDVSLTLASGRRYGLIGRNGSGKTTLLNSFQKYEYKELRMAKVLLVDQHVEGDDDNAVEWCLRSDIERTMLLEEEKLLSRYLQYNAETATEPVSTCSGHTTVIMLSNSWLRTIYILFLPLCLPLCLCLCLCLWLLLYL